jgi:DNA-binding response OmpR family regulator
VATVVCVLTALHLVDAQPATQGFLERHLPFDGFELVHSNAHPELVLAGEVDAVERWRDRAPVIVLGRDGDDAVDCVQAFRRGCDDYLPLQLPFAYEELVERIRAVLRRTRPPVVTVIEAPPVRIDTRTREVRIAGRQARLPKKEYLLLAQLASEPERVFTKAELLRDVWGYAVAGHTRTLDSHASRLRRKLSDLEPSVAFVDNVWGVGYRLMATPPSG